MTPGGRKGTGEETCDPSSALMTWRQDEQTDGIMAPNFRKPASILRWDCRSKIFFGWSGGAHKIHRAGRPGSAPTVHPFSNCFVCREGSPDGKHPNQQDERRRKEGNPRPNEACTARASDRIVCVCVRGRVCVCVHVCMGPRSRAALGAQSRIGVFLPSRVFAAHAGWSESWLRGVCGVVLRRPAMCRVHQ